MTLQFHMDVDTALAVYDRFAKEKPENEEQRVKIVVEMAKAGYPISIFQTNRTPDEIAKDLSKHGDVLHIKGEDYATE